MKILYLKGSPRSARSHSNQIADAFVQAVQTAAPDTEVIIKELAELNLPKLDEETLNGKYNIMHGRAFTDAQKAKWAAVETVIAEFKSANAYLFSVPMWNFTIPYPLLHYLDVIVQPTYTFAAGPEGYKGLTEGKKAVICYARGGFYPEDSPVNFQSPYLEFILNFIGITDITTLAVEGTLGDKDTLDIAKEQLLTRIPDIANAFVG